MKRQSNIELLRLIAMMMVVAIHTNYLSLGRPTLEMCQQDTLYSFIKIFHEKALLVCINVFIMISGWFGIHPSKRGISGFFFQVFFYSLLAIPLAYVFSGFHLPSITDMAKELYFGYSYWFVPAYVILLALSPALNLFVEQTSKSSLEIFLIAYFCISTIYGHFVNVAWFSHGTSALWFIGVYVFARYLRLYSPKFSRLKPSADFGIYLLVTILSAVISFLCFRTRGNDPFATDYNAPLTLVCSLFFFLPFTKFSFSHSTINALAASSFAIYLLHNNFLVTPFFINLMQHIDHSFHGISYFFITIPVVLLISLAAILIDQGRIKCWKVFERCLKFNE